MRIENLEIIWGINRQKLKKNADACRIWPLLVIIPNIGEFFGKIKEGEKVVFSAKINLSAEQEDCYNVKEYFTDVKIIEIK